MKIAIVSAVFGGIDYKKSIPEQSIKFDRYYFNEHNSPFPLSSLNNRMKAKYFKTQLHKVVPGYDIYIWIDGSVQVDSPKFVETVIKQLGENDFAFRKHTFRNCIYQEADFIEASIVGGDQYLVDRYADSAIREEVEQYRQKGFPKNAGLYEGGVFAVRATACDLFDNWWNACLLWSHYDQFSLRVLLDGRKVSTLDVDKLFHLVNHGTTEPLKNVSFSIVIPTYEQMGKGHIVVKQLLDSIASQRCKHPYEVVISDNSNNNKIEKVAMKYDDFFDLKYVRNTVGYGVSNNTNNAIDNAKYSIIKPMYQDDVLLDEHALNKFCEGIKNHGWVVSDSYSVDAKLKKKFTIKATFDPKCLTSYNPIGMPSVIMFRRNGLRFDPALKTMLDLYFYHQLFAEYGSPAFIDKPIVGQRLWENQISNNQANYANSEIDYIRKNGKGLSRGITFINNRYENAENNRNFVKLLLQ